MRAGLLQSVEGLKGTGGGRLNFLCLTEAGTLSSPALSIPGSGLQSQTSIYTISSLALRPLTYAAGLPGSPARRWQMVELLSLHNCVN